VAQSSRVVEFDSAARESRMEQAWILLGMMGAGKSTVGRALAVLSEREFLDSDHLLENRFGRPVHQIFKLYGEEAFRGHETSVLKTLEPGPIVLATGGGIVLKPQNWDEFRRLGKSVYFNVPAEVLKRRLEASKRRRPLLETENWEAKFDEIFESRQDLYRQADLIIDLVHGDQQDTAQQIFDALRSAE
jgi:shikimate kinase